MDSKQWDEIQTLFHKCISLPLNEQSTFIEELQSNNGSLANEVQKLLTAHTLKTHQKFGRRNAGRSSNGAVNYAKSELNKLFEL